GGAVVEPYRGDAAAGRALRLGESGIERRAGAGVRHAVGVGGGAGEDLLHAQLGTVGEQARADPDIADVLAGDEVAQHAAGNGGRADGAVWHARPGEVAGGVEAGGDRAVDVCVDARLEAVGDRQPGDLVRVEGAGGGAEAVAEEDHGPAGGDLDQ